MGVFPMDNPVGIAAEEADPPRQETNGNIESITQCASDAADITCWSCGMAVRHFCFEMGVNKSTLTEKRSGKLEE